MIFNYLQNQSGYYSTEPGVGATPPCRAAAGAGRSHPRPDRVQQLGLT